MFATVLQRAALYAYALATMLAQPVLRAKLARRARAEPMYAHAVAERFGRYGAPPPEPGALWIHAVSLGETRAAAVLLAVLRTARPGLRVLLTHGTATGRAEGETLLRPGDAQAWLPWDTPQAVARFLAHFRPAAGVLMETEVWPQLVAACRAAGVPLLLANARLGEASLRRALRLAPLARPAYAGLSGALAQTAADRDRLRQLGTAVHEQPMGNLKFDAEPDPALLAQGRAWRTGLQRPVLMLASSRDGEEAGLLAALQEKWPRTPHSSAPTATENPAHPVPLLVPRHPQRFDAVARLAQSMGWRVQRRSHWGGEGPHEPAADELWLGDSLGEMALYYGLADVALLGGSFEPFGGQNLIEAAACGCPIVVGPHTHNFAEATEQALAAGCARRVADLAQALRIARQWLDRPADLLRARDCTQAFVAPHRGSALRQAREILSALP